MTARGLRGISPLQGSRFPLMRQHYKGFLSSLVYGGYCVGKLVYVAFLITLSKWIYNDFPIGCILVAAIYFYFPYWLYPYNGYN